MEKKRYCNHHEETRPKYFYYHLPFNRVIEKMIISIQEYSIYSTILQYLKRYPKTYIFMKMKFKMFNIMYLFWYLQKKKNYNYNVSTSRVRQPNERTHQFVSTAFHYKIYTAQGHTNILSYWFFLLFAHMYSLNIKLFSCRVWLSKFYEN